MSTSLSNGELEPESFYGTKYCTSTVLKDATEVYRHPLNVSLNLFCRKSFEAPLRSLSMFVYRVNHKNVHDWHQYIRTFLLSTDQQDYKYLTFISFKKRSKDCL